MITKVQIDFEIDESKKALDEIREKLNALGPNSDYHKRKCLMTDFYMAKSKYDTLRELSVKYYKVL